MEEQKNMAKYEAYRSMYINLGKALKAGFYYQAIFIEYAIFEDRLASLLRYAGVPTVRKDGREDKISRKIAKVRDHNAFNTKSIRSRLPVALMDELKLWTEQRNALVHDLANMPYDNEQVKAVALDGERILKDFKAGASAVIRNFKKQAQ